MNKFNIFAIKLNEENICETISSMKLMKISDERIRNIKEETQRIQHYKNFKKK